MALIRRVVRAGRCSCMHTLEPLRPAALFLRIHSANRDQERKADVFICKGSRWLASILVPQAPVTGFVLAQGTHQTGCRSAELQRVCIHFGASGGLLTSPLARAASWLLTGRSEGSAASSPSVVSCPPGRGYSSCPGCRVAARAGLPRQVALRRKVQCHQQIKVWPT